MHSTSLVILHQGHVGRTPDRPAELTSSPDPSVGLQKWNRVAICTNLYGLIRKDKKKGVLLYS